MPCLSCGTKEGPWHDIKYKSGASMFPLCEVCWSRYTPNERKRYVSKLLFIWFRDGASINEILEIEKKVYSMIEKGEA